MDEVAAVSRSTALRWARFAAAHLRDLLILLVGLTTLLFFLLRLAGDPAVVIAGADASAEQLAEVRAAYGLDRPIWQQYASYLGRLILFDPGTSLISAEPALEAVLRVLPATLALAMLGMATTLAIAVPLGACGEDETDDDEADQHDAAEAGRAPAGRWRTASGRLRRATGCARPTRMALARLWMESGVPRSLTE